MENIKLLECIIGASKEFSFEDSILSIRKYYNTSDCIYIDFTRLLELMKEKFTEEEIKECLFNEEEFEEKREEEW